MRTVGKEDDFREINTLALKAQQSSILIFVDRYCYLDVKTSFRD
ncbi:UNVERIFIED_ORG: hypothetical protein GGE53_006054 [Rhizobium etli]